MEKKTAKAGTEKAAVKTEETKAVAEEIKEQPAAAETEVKETEEKPKAKRGPKPGSKNAKKTEKTALKPGVILQFQGAETSVDDAIEKIKAQFVSEGHRVSTIKDLQVYLKPEESAAYYVINQKFAGRIDLF